MKQKILIFLITMVSCFDYVYLQQPKSAEFLIPSNKNKKISSNELKEKIGQKIKKTLERSTDLTKQIGQMQCSMSSLQHRYASTNNHLIHMKKIITDNASMHHTIGQMHQNLSVVQKKCFSAVEKLIDNQKPFKKASKTVLQKTLEILDVSHQKLQTSGNSFFQLNNSLKDQATHKKGFAEHMKAAMSLLEQEKKILEQIQTSFNQDECLKHA